jgi:anion-transporting  ArsA/GET3 family ATPase
MAMEKLYELHSGGSGVDFDLVVIDTPPTRNALDFLDAPRRLTRFLDHRLFRLLAMPTRLYLKAVSVAAQAFVRTVTRVVGGEVIADVLAFFNAFEGMEEGFRQRAKAVYELLADPATAFVLVASPRRDSVDEALYFARKLAESDITVAAVVVNRVFPRFGTSTGRQRHAEGGSSGLAVLEANLADLNAVATKEAETVQELSKAVDWAPLQAVPLLPGDVHDLDGLRELSGFLFGRVA